MKKAKHWSPTTKEDREMWRMVKAMSPEQFIAWQKDMAEIFVKFQDRASKTPEELTERRDSMLATPFSPPVFAAELKKKFHEKILEKRGSPFKTIKGGRRDKKIRQTLKGTFDL
jgi:hypothetical protein